MNDGLIEHFGLAHLLKRKYKQLSVGQKRRLHLVMAISHQPKILILDEPTAGLDVQGRVELHQSIRKLKEEEMTIILASHDMAEVELLCDRIAILVQGEVMFTGTNQEFMNEHNKDRIIKVRTTKRVNTAHGFAYCEYIREQEGYYVFRSNDLDQSLNELLGSIRRDKNQVVDLHISSRSLEERFVQVTNKESRAS